MSTYAHTLKLNEHWSDYLIKTDSYIYNWCERCVSFSASKENQ